MSIWRFPIRAGAPDEDDTDGVFQSFLAGFPTLILHFSITVGLLAIGVTIYIFLTPIREIALIRQNNLDLSADSTRAHPGTPSRAPRVRTARWIYRHSGSVALTADIG